MKSITNSIGYLTALSIALYTIFKFCFIEGAWWLMIISGIFLSIYFLVMIPDKLRKTSEGKILPVHIAAALTTSILNLAFLSTLQKWTTSGIFFSIGFAVFCLLFIPLLFIHRSKQPNANILADATGALGLVAITLGINNKLLHWSASNTLFITGLVLLLLVYFPLYILDKSISSKKKSKYLQDALFAVIFGLIFLLFVLGIVLHWKVTMNYDN
jgi:hypothetical protein